MVASNRSAFEALPSGFVSLSDHYTAEYYELGDGEPLVVVPGLAGGAGLVRPLLESLAEDFHVVCFELRGETSHFCDRWYHFDRLVRDLGEFVDGMGLERPGILGLSFGGAIALDYATRCPGKLSFLAVQGAGPNHRGGPFAGVARRVLERLHLPDNNPFVNQFFRLLTADRNVDAQLMDFVVERCWRTDQSVMAHRFALLDEYDVTERLGRLRMPVLSLTGENDVLASPTAQQTLRTLVSSAESQTIAGAGHFAFVTHPERVAAAVRDFHRCALAAI